MKIRFPISTLLSDKTTHTHAERSRICMYRILCLPLQESRPWPLAQTHLARSAYGSPVSTLQSWACSRSSDFCALTPLCPPRSSSCRPSPSPSPWRSRNAPSCWLLSSSTVAQQRRREPPMQARPRNPCLRIPYRPRPRPDPKIAVAVVALLNH